MDEETKKALLVEFMETVYHSVLDDTAHFIEEHAGDLQQVWKEWTEQYGFAKCTVSECVKSARHYGRGRRTARKGKGNGNGKREDALYEFYESIFDRFHNYLAHLYQIGLRVDMESLVKNEEEKDDDNIGGMTVDSTFAAERDHIKSMRKECQMDLDRLDNENNKYTIQSEEKKTKWTLTDAIFKKLTETLDIHRDEVNRLKKYLERNQFDSDGLVEDLEDPTDSNTERMMQNALLIDTMATFIRSIQCVFNIRQLHCNVAILLLSLWKWTVFSQ